MSNEIEAQRETVVNILKQVNEVIALMNSHTAGMKPLELVLYRTTIQKVVS